MLTHEVTAVQLVVLWDSFFLGGGNALFGCPRDHTFALCWRGPGNMFIFYFPAVTQPLETVQENIFGSWVRVGTLAGDFFLRS